MPIYLTFFPRPTVVNMCRSILVANYMYAGACLVHCTANRVLEIPVHQPHAWFYVFLSHIFACFIWFYISAFVREFITFI